MRQRIPLPATAWAARCFGLFGISARAVVATTWQEPTIRYLQTTICPKSIRSSACPLIAPSSPLSTPISDHFLNPLNYLRDDKVSSFPVFPSRTSSPCVPCQAVPSEIWTFFSGGANISYSGETSMQRLGTVAQGKTLKTSPPAVAAAWTVFRAKTRGIGWHWREAKFVQTHSGIFDPFTFIPDKSL